MTEIQEIRRKILEDNPKAFYEAYWEALSSYFGNRLNLSAGSITAQARGETDLARATRDGVREPLNRRTAVTISFR